MTVKTCVYFLRRIYYILNYINMVRGCNLHVTKKETENMHQNLWPSLFFSVCGGLSVRILFRLTRTILWY
jgi:hypothetical protein